MAQYNSMPNLVLVSDRGTYFKRCPFIIGITVKQVGPILKVRSDLLRPFRSGAADDKTLTASRAGLFTYDTTKRGRGRYHKATFVVTAATHVAYHLLN